MKTKKLISMMLALIMALALAVPAMAEGETTTASWDKIEDEDTLNQFKGKGASFDIGNNTAIVIKQAGKGSSDGGYLLWVSSYDIIGVDKSADEATLKHAAEVYVKSLSGDGSMKSMPCAGVLVGDTTGTVKDTTVSVSNGVMTIVGAVSHLNFNNKKPDIITPNPDPDDPGVTSTTFTMMKTVDETGIPNEEFTFEVYNEANEKVNATVTTEDKIIYNFKFDPKLAEGTYEIREVLTPDQKGMYEDGKTLSFAIDANGSLIGETPVFNNVSLGKLEYTKPAVTEQYKELWHTPIYEKVEQYSQTMVSIPVDMDNLPAGVTKLTSKGINSGFTYLEVDKKALAANGDGATFGIVNKVDHMSDETMRGLTIPTLSPDFPWEEGRPATYTLTLNGNTLHMESTLPNFRLTFSNLKETVTVTEGKGKKKVKVEKEIDVYPEHKGAHVGEDVYSWDYDVSGLDENFRVMVHYENNGYYTDKVIGCDPATVIERQCERPVPEACVAVTVTNAAGAVIPDENLDKLPAGEYTVTVTVGGQVLDTQTVNVYAGQTTTVTFPDNLTIQGTDEPHCANPSCSLNQPVVNPSI